MRCFSEQEHRFAGDSISPHSATAGRTGRCLRDKIQKLNESFAMVHPAGCRGPILKSLARGIFFTLHIQQAGEQFSLNVSASGCCKVSNRRMCTCDWLEQGRQSRKTHETRSSQRKGVSAKPTQACDWDLYSYAQRHPSEYLQHFLWQNRFQNCVCLDEPEWRAAGLRITTLNRKRQLAKAFGNGISQRVALSLSITSRSETISPAASCT